MAGKVKMGLKLGVNVISGFGLFSGQSVFKHLDLLIFSFISLSSIAFSLVCSSVLCRYSNLIFVTKCLIFSIFLLLPSQSIELNIKIHLLCLLRRLTELPI